MGGAGIHNLTDGRFGNCRMRMRGFVPSARSTLLGRSSSERAPRTYIAWTLTRYIAIAQTTFGGGLRGRMDDHLMFFCSCRCIAPFVLFKKEITLVSPSFDIWVATNASATGRGLVPTDLIVQKELKHVTQVRQFLNRIRDSLEVHADAIYGSYGECAKGCPAIFDCLRDMYARDTRSVDATHPSY